MNPETLHKISYGLYIVASAKEGKNNGQIANAVMQIAAEPPTIAISINKKNLTHEHIAASKVFSISVLEKGTPLPFIGQFGFKSGREIDKFKGINFKAGRSGAPVVLDHSLAAIEAEVISTLDCGSHTLFLGKVTEAEILRPDLEPMTYAYYHDVKKGTSPANAPTYIKNEEPAGREIKMKKYKCKVCGYIYDPAVGDPDGGVAPGTAFEAIPDSWVCPVCGAAKDQFEEVK